MCFCCNLFSWVCVGVCSECFFEIFCVGFKALDLFCLLSCVVLYLSPPTWCHA